MSAFKSGAEPPERSRITKNGRRVPPRFENGSTAKALAVALCTQPSLRRRQKLKPLKSGTRSALLSQTFFSPPMADFSFLSDTDDSAVEDLISQATDLSVLEQVAAINCSAFSDSVLPTELETRFRKLKSFPSSQTSAAFRTEIRTASAKPGSGPAVFSPSKQNPGGQANRGSGFSSGKGGDPEERNGEAEENPEEKFSGWERNVSFSSSSKEFPEENFAGSRKKTDFSPSKRTPAVKKNPNWGSLSSPSSDSSDLSLDSPSPPQKAGCFFCSPMKKSKKNQSSSSRRRKDELVSDLSIFSEKSQRKILKKVMKEEEKINREAEEIMKWAKQASARMNISDIEDERSDDDKP